MTDLPRLRKQPKQARSQALVDAVVQTCLQILDHEPADSLTMERLSEQSGVTVGSIYQYFSTKEGVIAAAYEQILHEEGLKLHQLGEAVKALSVSEALRRIFAHALRVELRLHRLSGGFHRKYYQHLSLLEQYRKTYAESNPGEAVWISFIDFFQAELAPNDKQVVATMLAHGYRGMTGALIDSHPQLVESDAFLDNLVLMALGCLRYRPADTACR